MDFGRASAYLRFERCFVPSLDTGGRETRESGTLGAVAPSTRRMMTRRTWLLLLGAFFTGLVGGYVCVALYFEVRT